MCKNFENVGRVKRATQKEGVHTKNQFQSGKDRIIIDLLGSSIQMKTMHNVLNTDKILPVVDGINLLS